MTGPQPNVHRRLLELRGPDPSAEPLLRQLVASLAERAPRELAQVEAAIGHGEAETVAAAAHKLHGAAANLGATELADRCEEVDNAARLGRLDLAEAELVRARTAYAELAPVLQELLVGWDGPANPLHQARTPP